ncbi:MAG: 50S ribosomal protein L17 [Thermoleophilia bacterium]|nr:50S ribosomal protein L17 [Thermoleophilia bacterium]
MRHRRNRHKLGRQSSHREATLMNLAGALIRHGRIRTTESKAKALRPYVERLVTKAREDNLQNRRVVRRTLRMHDTASARKAGQRTIVQELFEDVAPRFKDRPGGYTRIVKLGSRPGDAAPMAFIEWVDYVPEAREYHDAHAHSHDFATEAEAAAHTHA